jgi:hypothetical protein
MQAPAAWRPQVAQEAQPLLGRRRAPRRSPALAPANLPRSIADRAGRGTANFGEVLLWFSQYLDALGVPAADENGDVWIPPSGLAAPVCVGL